VAARARNLTALQDLQWTLNKLSDFVRQRLNDRVRAEIYREMVGINPGCRRQPATRTGIDRLKDDWTKLASLLLS